MLKVKYLLTENKKTNLLEQSFIPLHKVGTQKIFIELDGWVNGQMGGWVDLWKDDCRNNYEA